ncbi:penicillin-binding protein 1C [Stenotrophobium rhamnosiphilum]|uniref:penicillin-binding protein 1C n=1 Tax=Stenotrophobium rhamnosiphilum TaxID=2029166 RepID=UPI0019D233C5|nr:penicillin-binding protein 1C [Stenotrophobium rhamnosiphilum]
MRKRFIAFGAVAVLLALGFTSWYLTAPPSPPDFAQVKKDYQPSDAWLLDRHGDVLAQVRMEYGRRCVGWVPLDQISPAVIDPVRQAEDHRFDTHGGVDGIALLGGLRDYALHRIRRGASTITMQLAAKIDPELMAQRGRRGLKQKWRQMRVAWQIESSWTKPQILEAYFNLVSFRSEWLGVQTASTAMFGKSAAHLNRYEGAVLAALLRNPAANASVIAARACRIASETNCQPYMQVATSALVRGLKPLMSETLAPHLARALVHRGGERVSSTVDLATQNLVYAALATQLSALSAAEVRDAAAVVLDNESGDVLAYVGSAGPSSTAWAVDGVNALRQAGSTLKPFLYSLAFEQRLLTPASLLDDSPVNLETGAGLYIPQNYDHEFRGHVSVRSALAGSLNVPAVRTLLLVGLEPFRDRLHDIGYRNGLTESGEFYGFSLALGAPEVSLLEQANAYRTLANAGRWSPVRLRAGDERATSTQIISPESAYLVGSILSDNGARAASFGLDSPLSTPFWSAVKTGTSKNMRDNWCIGYTTRYTVAVWVGNFEGDPMHNVSGVTGAAPAWLEIITALSRGSEPASPKAPSGIVQSRITFHDHEEPARNEWFIDGTELSEIRATPTGLGRAHIRAPANGMIAALDPDIPVAHQNVLFEAEGADNARWVLDGRDIGMASKKQLWVPRPGRHRLQVLSKDGKEVDAVSFEVRATVSEKRGPINR